jgi:hypothetical protein
MNANTLTAEQREQLAEQIEFEAQWAASPALQAEFPDAKCYAAFTRAERRGQVRILVHRE